MDSRLCCLGVALSLFIVPYISGVDGCSMAWPDVCKDIKCPKGNTCTPYSGYWCANKTGSVCYPRGRCDNADPCKTATCSKQELCVQVLDQCNNKGGCTFKSQCNEIKRKGTCPNPEAVRGWTTSCANGCDNDATCQKGAKCCEGGPFGKVCVSPPK